jgi:hypothetical protein
VQINETETPLHRLETVYRRLVEHLGTADTASGAFRGVIDGWFYALEQDVLADASVDASDAEGLLLRTECADGGAGSAPSARRRRPSLQCCEPTAAPWQPGTACWRMG